MNRYIRTAPAYQGPLRVMIVAAAHVLALWVVADALNMKLPVGFDTILQIVDVDQRPPTVIRPPTVPNGVRPPRERVEDIPLVAPQIPRDFDTTTITPEVAPVGADGGVAPAPQLRAASIDLRHPLTQPAYPAASIRFLEQGVVELDLHIGADGRVVEARVARSSGFARLDAAAVAEALRAWRLRPATGDGVAIDSWCRQRVNFQLQDLR